MYLKSVEIYGFKSFARKTTLKFERGITVIVGPNGCGKSNVMDAIRWGLGEQSPKSLRGNKMEDIIFNGTEKEPPLNYAEVTLNFSNQNRVFDIGFEEVSISRKLFRSGESEYYLNRSLVRLKDIQDILLSVGLGEGSYSFVAQGMIEHMLMAKPEQKRIIFDEASGILKFKERKREVLRKLEDTDNNLIRLEDIVTEVKRQRDSLHRQVQRAERYQQVQEELRGTEKKISGLKLQESDLKKQALEKELKSFSSGEEEKQGEIKKKQAGLEEITLELEQLRVQQKEASAKVFSSESEINSLTHQIEVNKQRIIDFQDRMSSIKSNTAVYSQRIVEQKERIIQIEKEIELIDANYRNSESNIKSSAELIEQKLSEMKDNRRLIKENNEKILGLEEDRVVFFNSLIDLQSRLNTFLARKKRLLLEISKSDSELGDYEERYSKLKRDIETIELEKTELEDRKSEVSSSIENIRQSKEKLSADRDEKEKELLSLSSQLEFMKDLKTKYEGFPDTGDVTILLEKEMTEIPSVIVAKIDKSLERDEKLSLFRIKTKAKVISQGLGRIEDKIKRLKEGIDSLNTQISGFQEKALSTQQNRDEVEKSLQDKERGLLKLKEIENSYKENLNRLKEERELINLEFKEAGEEIASLREKESRFKEELSGKDSEISLVKEAIKASEDKIREGESSAKELEINIAKLKTLLSSLEEEKKNRAETLNIFSRDLDAAVKQLESLEAESLELQSKITLRTGENDNFVSEIEVKSKSVEQFKKESALLADKDKELNAESRAVSEGIKALFVKLEEIRKKVYDKKLDMRNLEFEESKVVTDMKQLYGVDLDIESVKAEKIEEPLSELLSQEEDLQRRIKYLGSVNLLAIDEYKELNERYEFLDSQRKDLLDSKDALKKAIAKINRTSRQMFLDVFNSIREEFKKLYRFLFGGGRAEIFMLDENNVLESGIDIVVQPPGKKLQSVNLLSGGEKSLTAMALIFAIFRIKPSPLCILDEIDAPLDETNIGRFSHLLSEFAKESQFIAMSHNKKTISQADVMYGVTMQESGISKIVSVKFSESSPEPSPSS